MAATEWAGMSAVAASEAQQSVIGKRRLEHQTQTAFEVLHGCQPPMPLRASGMLF